MAGARTIGLYRRIGAIDFGGDGADQAFAGILDAGQHAGMQLQHFAKSGGDEEEALAQGGRRALGNADIEALGFPAIDDGQLLDFRIGRRQGLMTAFLQDGDIGFQRRDDALGQADQALDAWIILPGVTCWCLSSSAFM